MAGFNNNSRYLIPGTKWGYYVPERTVFGVYASSSVLELLAEPGLALPGGTIAHNLEKELSEPPSRATVYRALDPLVEHGLLVEEGAQTAHYRISEDGERYLDGDLDTNEIEGTR